MNFVIISLVKSCYLYALELVMSNILSLIKWCMIQVEYTAGLSLTYFMMQLNLKFNLTGSIVEEFHNIVR